MSENKDWENAVKEGMKLKGVDKMSILDQCLLKENTDFGDTDPPENRNKIVDLIIGIAAGNIIIEKYGITYDPMMKKWVKILTREEAQKIVDEVDAKVIK